MEIAPAPASSAPVTSSSSSSSSSSVPERKSSVLGGGKKKEPQAVPALRRCSRSVAAADDTGLATSGVNIDRAESLAHSVVEDVRRAMAGFDPKSPNIVALFPIVPLLMAQAEGYANVTGPEKKAIVMIAIKTALQVVTPLEYQPLVLPLVDPIVGPMIDAGVQASKLLNEASAAASRRCLLWCAGSSAGKTKPSTTATTNNTSANATP